MILRNNRKHTSYVAMTPLLLITIGALAGLSNPSVRAMAAGLLVLRGPKNLDVHTVIPADLTLTVTASGVLESVDTVEVTSDVAGKAAIVRMVKAGKSVQAGEPIVELDVSHLKMEAMQQRVVVEQAKSMVAMAKERLQRTRNECGDVEHAAGMAVETSVLDLHTYLEGTFPQEQRMAVGQVMLADEQREQAEKRIAHTRDLQGMGYLSDGQVAADDLSLLRTSVTLDLAKARRTLLEEFTYVRTRQSLEAAKEQADRNLATSRRLSETRIEQALANLESQSFALKLEESRLEELQHQIDNAILSSPQDGVVLYPVPEDEDQPLPIRHGALVQQRQIVFSIPDTRALQVRGEVHEAEVQAVKPGDRVRVWVESLPGLELAGTVGHVGSVPDPQSWRKGNVHFYPLTIQLANTAETNGSLRPMMNVRIEIVTQELTGVLAIPVAAVAANNDELGCYVLNEADAVRWQSIELGQSTDDLVHVQKGLDFGERVVRNPAQITSSTW